MPLSTARLDHPALEGLVTTGLPALDQAVGGGFRRGSSALITGGAGTGKSLLAATFLDAACRRGETAILMNFEESPEEFIFNANAVGIDLRPHIDAGLLAAESARPMLLGLEQHLVEIYRQVERIKPQAMVVDPLSSLTAAGTPSEVHRTVIRLIDHLKRSQITTVYTAEQALSAMDQSELGVSSIIDAWLSLAWDRTTEPFRRYLTVIKKRGSGHAKNRVPFEISGRGIAFESGRDE